MFIILISYNSFPAKASSAATSDCLNADLMVTCSSTISISFIAAICSFMSFAAIGAHEPFSMKATFLFWYAFIFRWLMKSAMTGITPPSYVGAASTSLSYLKASSIHSAISSLERSDIATFGAPFASSISASFFAAFSVLPWRLQYAMKIPSSSCV